MKDTPANPGGSLKSKPTWPNAFGSSATSAFFVLSEKKHTHGGKTMQLPTVADAHRNGIAVAAKERLWQSAYSSLQNISCECDGGVLILRGQVPNFFQKQLAQRIRSSSQRCHAGREPDRGF